MNSHFMLTSQKQKAQMTTLLIDFMQNMNYTKTAQLIKKQSNRKNTNSILQQVQEVAKNNLLDEQTKDKIIESILKNELINLLKQDKTSQALQLFQGIMVKYIKNVDIYTTYFVQLPKSKQPLLSKFIVPYFSKCYSAPIPKYRVFQGDLDIQIRFVISNQKFSVIVNKKNKLHIFQDNQIVATKDDVHKKQISVVKWVSEDIFATGSKDRTIKLWNEKLQCLTIINKHQKMITCLTVSWKYIISGGNDPYILLTQQNQPSNYLKIQSRSLSDMHYLHNKDQLITVAPLKSKTYISFLDVNCKQELCSIIQDSRIYLIQVSKRQQYLYTNCSNGEIHMWDLKYYTIFRKFSGHQQSQFLMRMSCGGQQDQYLAVTSQNSEIIFYHFSRSTMIGKIQIQPKTVINCVSWIGEKQVLIGCDDGRIEQWSCDYRQQSTFQVESPLIERAQQLFRNIIPSFYF